MDQDKIVALRWKYDLPMEFILYLGGFDCRKNVLLLIRSFSNVLKRLDTGIKLVLAGNPVSRNPRLFPDPRPLIEELGLQKDVILVGQVPEEEKPLFYSASTLFVFPSVYEGFGLPPLEAMACGAPVLCSNASSLPEVVGEAGYLFDPHNEHELTKSLVEVLGDDEKRARMVKEGLKQAASFSWDKVTDRTITIYRKLLEGSL